MCLYQRAFRVFLLEWKGWPSNLLPKLTAPLCSGCFQSLPCPLPPPPHPRPPTQGPDSGHLALSVLFAKNSHQLPPHLDLDPHAPHYSPLSCSLEGLATSTSLIPTSHSFPISLPPGASYHANDTALLVATGDLVMKSSVHLLVLVFWLKLGVPSFWMLEMMVWFGSRLGDPAVPYPGPLSLSPTPTSGSALTMQNLLGILSLSLCVLPQLVLSLKINKHFLKS